jgi:hypothetical protein
MAEKPFRLIGPNNNRLLTALDVEARLRGQVSHEVAKQLLLKAGWRRYSGPGRDDDGWYVPGSDEHVVIKPSMSNG